MRIVFLSRWFPEPPVNGAKLRVFHLVRWLAERHDVHLISVADDGRTAPEAPRLAARCRRIEAVPWRPVRPHSARALFGFVHPTPRALLDAHSAALAQRLERAVADGADLIIASQIDMAAYAPWFADRPALFEEVELGALYDPVRSASTAWRRTRAGLTWWKHRHYVAGLLRRFAACTVVSEPERRLLARAAPAAPPIAVVPNGVDTAAWPPAAPPEPDSLIFAGALSYAANHDAMTWFVREVYPRVQAQRPAVRLTITGDGGGARLPRASNVVQTGAVADVRPLVASAWASIAPMRQGGGTRLKILESMAVGTPVVATAKGAQGLDVIDGEHLLLADDPSAFARRVVGLLGDPALRAHLAAQARRLVEERYDWSVVLPRLGEVVERAASCPPGRR